MNHSEFIGASAEPGVWYSTAGGRSLLMRLRMADFVRSL